MLALLVFMFFLNKNTKQNNQQPSDITVLPSTAEPATAITQTSPLPMKIGEIQGLGHRSPFENQEVQGVICVITFKTGDGFYCQDEEPDSDIGTSDGIFVSTFAGVSLQKGMTVQLDGTVDEVYPGGLGSNDLPVTTIIKADVNVIDTSIREISPTIIGINGLQPPSIVIEDDGFKTFDPASDGIDFYESLENMLVQIDSGKVVSSTNDYRELVVVPDCKLCGPYTPTGGIYITKDDPNPERIIIDAAFASISPKFYGTEITSSLVGIIGYGYENYRIHSIKDFNTSGSTPLEPYTRSNLEQLTIASYNVENLGPAESNDRITQIAKQIVLELDSPELLNLVEIQDSSGVVNDGITDASKTLDALVNAVIGEGGPSYRYVSVDPENNKDGGIDGGNIRNVILYRSDRNIQLVSRGSDPLAESKVLNNSGRAYLSQTPGRIKPTSGSFFNSRKPLVVEFRVNNESLFFISVHLNSKGPDQGLFGSMQPPQTPSTGQRTNQAALISQFADAILDIDPQANIVIAGDFNDFPFSEPMMKLNNMMSSADIVDENQRYSFVFEGNSQLLDDIYLSPKLHSKLRLTRLVHLNTSRPYNEQVSDHDPIVIELGN